MLENSEKLFSKFPKAKVDFIKLSFFCPIKKEKFMEDF